MKTIHRKLMALAILATAGLTVDGVAIAAEQEDDVAITAEQDDGAEVQSIVRARCPPTTNVCQSPSVLFPGGTISIDADVTGGGTATWVLTRDGAPRCQTNFPAVDPPRSWVCNLPRGNYKLLVYTGQSGYRAEGAIRW